MSFFNDTAPAPSHVSPLESEVSLNGILTGLRVLLVEDEPLIALDIEELCRENGAEEVVTVRRMEDADALDLSSFHVAIVDLVLGQNSSLPLAALIKAHGLPLIFTSGYSATPELAMDFPGVTLLAKPYAGETLIDAIAAAISSRNA